MFKFCDKCGTKIGFRKKFKLWNNSTYKGYTCEDCATKYKPTILSLFIYFIVIWFTFMFVFMSELNLKIGFFLCFILLVTVNLITPSIVIRYKSVD
ncbi:MAG: hypothetical protein RSD22_11780 [Romboutsia sp.]